MSICIEPCTSVTRSLNSDRIKFKASRFNDGTSDALRSWDLVRVSSISGIGGGGAEGAGGGGGSGGGDG